MALRDRRDIRRQIARLEKRLPRDELVVGVVSDDAAAESLRARHPETNLVMITGVPEAAPCDKTIDHTPSFDDPTPDDDPELEGQRAAKAEADFAQHVSGEHVTFADLKRRSETGFAVPMIDPLAGY